MKSDQKRIDKGLYWDRAWSLVEGCSYVSEGCRSCWSASQAHIRSKQSNPKIRERYSGVTDTDGRWNGKIKFLHENLYLPTKVKNPQIWSVWNDLFHEGVTQLQFDEAIDVVHGDNMRRMGRLGKPHIYLFLTKRPKRMKRMFESYFCTSSGMPPYFWLGVTAENQQTACERIPILLQIPAKVRFVSVEPMLSEINLEPYLHCGISWCIIGCESGHNARPMKIDWARSLIKQCKMNDVPVFLKQLRVDSKIVKMPEIDGKSYAEYPVLKGW